jgi:hypothetical protein
MLYIFVSNYSTVVATDINKNLTFHLVFVAVTSVVMSPLQTSNLQQLAQSFADFLVHSSSAPCLPAAVSVLQ